MKILHIMLFAKYNADGMHVGTMYQNNVLTVARRKEDSEDILAKRTSSLLVESMNNAHKSFSEKYPEFTFQLISGSALVI